MKLFRRLTTLLLILLMLPLSASGAEGNSITIRYSREGQPIAGAAFQLYRMEGTFEDARQAYAAILESGQAPMAQAKTDDAGSTAFSNLEDGTYLLTGTPHRVGNKILHVEATLYTLPCADETGAPTGHITVEPKFSQEEDESLEYRVLVIWEGEQPHPDAAVLRLYRNGVLDRTVTLDKAANWQYTWQETDPTAVWTVVEAVPAGYTCAYHREGNTFVVINTPEKEDPTDPTETAPEETTQPSQPKLPQTGQLWWPVPILALSGFVLLVLGWLRRKESRDEA